MGVGESVKVGVGTPVGPASGPWEASQLPTEEGPRPQMQSVPLTLACQAAR